MPALVAKLQRCGKPNCRCSTVGELHGPYFWMVSYRRKQERQGRGRYEWKYLGKSPEIVIEKLAREAPDFLRAFGKHKIVQEMRRTLNTPQLHQGKSSMSPRIKHMLELVPEGKEPR